jgi:hypothetical protein
LQTDIDPELEQVTMKRRRFPQGIANAHKYELAMSAGTFGTAAAPIERAAQDDPIAGGHAPRRTAPNIQLTPKEGFSLATPPATGMGDLPHRIRFELTSSHQKPTSLTTP